MRIYSFSGGFRFKRFAGQPREELIDVEPPPRVLIPLAQGFGNPLQPAVQVGDRVSAGEIIAHSEQTISSPVHSSIAGRISAIEKRNYFNREVIMVVVEALGSEVQDGAGGFQRLEGYSPEWEKLDPNRLEELIYKAGVSSLDREGIPTSFRSSVISPKDVEEIIIHGACSEAYNISLKVLLAGKNLYNFVEGMRILKKIAPQARVHLAINCREKALVESLRKLTSKLKRFRIYPVLPKYPQGYDEVLVPTILKKDFPYGYSAANIGVVVLNIQAILHLYQAVAEGKPLIERIIALCGPGFKENIHLKVRVGTPLEFILKDRLWDSSRIFLNSLLTGFELKDHSLPIDRTFSQLIAIPEGRERRFLSFARPGLHADSYSRTFFSSFLKIKKIPDTNLHGEERPCIQCGYCAQVCPVGIIPQLLYRYIRMGINETLLKFGIFKCISCNLCSYVCPCKIPLAKSLNDAKRKLIEIGCDIAQCILPRFNLRGLEEYRGVKKLR